jgi:integrase
MALKVVKRKSTGAWTISGTVAGIRIQKRASTNNRRLATEEAAALEARILREQWHGPKPGSRTIGEAALSYAEAVPRSSRTLKRLARVIAALGDGSTPLAEIDQDALSRLRAQLLKPGAGPATFAREIGVPLRALMRYAARQDWCREPHFLLPRPSAGRTLFLLPAEAERLIAAANDHIRPLLIFLLGTGARASEALRLEWQDVDLVGQRAVFWETKSGKRRNATLPTRVVTVLSALPHREGPVFRHRSAPYTINGLGEEGGQFRWAFTTAVRKAGLDPKITPHVCRHTWASWFYALHRDPIALKQEGGWGSLAMVERYVKLLPEGHEGEIRTFFGDDTVTAGVWARKPI